MDLLFLSENLDLDFDKSFGLSLWLKLINEREMAAEIQRGEELH